jgi:hypothetical protein
LFEIFLNTKNHRNLQNSRAEEKRTLFARNKIQIFQRLRKSLWHLDCTIIVHLQYRGPSWGPLRMSQPVQAETFPGKGSVQQVVTGACLPSFEGEGEVCSGGEFEENSSLEDLKRGRRKDDEEVF